MIDQQSNATVLNVLGRDFMHARCIPDRLDIGKPKIDYYTVSQLNFLNFGFLFPFYFRSNFE